MSPTIRTHIHTYGQLRVSSGFHMRVFGRRHRANMQKSPRPGLEPTTFFIMQLIPLNYTLNYVFSGFDLFPGAQLSNHNNKITPTKTSYDEDNLLNLF